MKYLILLAAISMPLLMCYAGIVILDERREFDTWTINNLFPILSACFACSAPVIIYLTLFVASIFAEPEELTQDVINDEKPKRKKKKRGLPPDEYLP